MDTLPQNSNRLAPPAAFGGHWWIVSLLMMVVALGHFNRVAMSVAGTERIIPQFGIPPAQMGLVYSAFLLCYTIAMLPGGWFIDRYGGRVALMVFMFGSAVFVALTGCVGLVFSEPYTVWIGLIAVRSVMGIVNAPLHPATANLVFERVPEGSRTFANGMATFAACVGISATFYGLGTLIDQFDWPIAFVVCSAVTLTAASIWTVGTRGRGPARDDRKKTLPSLRSMFKMLGCRSMICITISYTALGYFQYVFFYWIQYYFKTVQQQGEDVARRYTTLITLVMGIGMASGGWMADHLPRMFSLRARRSAVPVVGMIASGIAFELGLLSSHQQFTLVGFALAALLIGACEGGFWTTVVELGGPCGGTAAGLMNTGGNAGGTLSPWMTPVLSAFFAQQFGESVGWRFGLAVAGLVSILGAVLWIGVEPGKRGE